MNIEEIIKQRESWYSWKNIAPLREELNTLLKSKATFINGDIFKLEIDTTKDEYQKIYNLALNLRPWRKGPFEIINKTESFFIDTEWQSFIKYNLIKPYFNLENKKVADIGCNNGYYMFRMLEDKPKKIVGFDPSPLFKTQFDFINHFVKSDIKYELLGVEHLEFYREKFDVIFCLGVLYHRSDPISTLKSLYRGLNRDGELILDTFMIEGEEEIALTPKDKYSKIPNIYFIPTINALKNWLLRAKFQDIELLEITKTNTNEQRKTNWILGESLEDFLDKNNPTLTIEGYPAPKRVYIKAKGILQTPSDN